MCARRTHVLTGASPEAKKGYLSLVDDKRSEMRHLLLKTKVLYGRKRKKFKIKLENS